MSFKSILVVFVCLVLIGCWVQPKDNQTVSDEIDRYFEFLKVNNDLTFSGVNELSVDKLVGKEYYLFTYKKGVLTNILSFSSVSKSFHELNKYIFNVNKEWKEINIQSTLTSQAYTFTNDGDLIKFIITYNEQKLPTKFQVLPFNINYDIFNILGNSVVYSGNLIYSKNKLLNKIIWLDSDAEYVYQYDRDNNVTFKDILNNGTTLYEYRFENIKQGIAKGIK